MLNIIEKYLHKVKARQRSSNRRVDKLGQLIAKASLSEARAELVRLEARYR
jgi:hypothetical protein